MTKFSNRDWLELVKETRVKFQVGISEAHRLILDDPTMKRLVLLRVNSQAECRKQALYDMRTNGGASIFVKEGGRLVYRS